MKSFYAILFLSLLLSFSAVLTSCRKETSDKNQQSFESKNETTISSILQKIPDWLDKHKTGVSADKIGNIDLLKQNLDWSGATIQKRNNGDNIIIIPIKEEFLITKTLDKNYILNLLLVQNATGSLKWCTVVYFLPADGKKQDALSSNTLQNIINNQSVNDSGMFKFLNVTGTLLYQLEYKNHKLYSWGRRVQNKESSETKTTNGTIKVNDICIDWYLLTTYYYDDGSTSETREYLGRSCVDSSGGGGSGGGGGGASDPEGLNDQVINKDVSLSKAETAYGDEDLAVIPTSSGVSSGPPFYSPFQYTYPAHILFNVETGIVQSVIQDNVLVSPANESYYLPSGDITTRNLVIQTNSRNWTEPSVGVVELYWSHTVYARYTTSGNSITKTYNGSFTAPVNVP